MSSPLEPKRLFVTGCNILVLMGAAGIILPLSSYSQNDSLQAGEERNATHGEGDEHRADPCEDLLDHPGNAIGIEKKCLPAGSSTGIVKGDFNGDGFADLAIGEPAATIDGLASAGRVIVIYGSADELTTNKTGIPQPQLYYEARIPGVPIAAAGDLFGTALAAGDFNGDGISDLATGIPGKRELAIGPSGLSVTSGVGAVVILYGSKSGGLSTSNPSYIDMRGFYYSNCNDSFLGPSGPDPGLPPFSSPSACPDMDDLPAFDAGSHFGQALTWGDFKGDGTSALVIGIPGYNSHGIVWVHGFSPGANDNVIEDETGLSAASPGDRFGAALAAGDFDGDGISDLAIGIPGESFPVCNASCTDVSGAGAVGIVTFPFGLTGETYHLDTVGAAITQENFGLSTSASGDNFGASLAAADFDGNGRPEVAIGVPLKDSGTLTDTGIVLVFTPDPGANYTPRNSGLSLPWDVAMNRGHDSEARWPWAILTPTARPIWPSAYPSRISLPSETAVESC
jgi:hypothetical protein